MAHSSLSKSQLGAISIVFGVLSWLMYFPPLSSLALPMRAISGVVGLVGFVFGAMSVKTKTGVIGIFLNLLAVFYVLFFLALWAAYGYSLR